jgi:hypothetical protein
MLGRTISHYRILNQLGAGGMGVVYRAEDLRLGRSVALKFLPEDLAKDVSAVDRLRSEARAASALNHGNICTIYDIDDYEGQPFIAMELMTGQTLRERLTGGHLKVHQLVDIGIQIADALDAAHSQGIVHRDIKPANIFLTDRHQVKILDFGLAKLSSGMVSSSTTGGAGDQLTAVGVTLGTVSYMSPEQATGEELDGRTDLFSLGVVLYECATGRQPFAGKTSAVILANILSRAPIAPVVLNPDLPLRLQDVINNCLEKDRELRYQSAADLRADLKRVRRDIESGHSRAIQAFERQSSVSSAAPAHDSGRQAAAAHDSGPAAPPSAPRAANRAAWAGAVIAVIAVLAAGLYFWSVRRPTDPFAVNRAIAMSQAAVQGRLDLATTSMDARNYRAALAYAGEVLAISPNHRGATKIRDDAQAMIARFDQAIAEARQRLASGDVTNAARMLDTARSIDPTSPVISDLSARLTEQNRQKEGTSPKPPQKASAEPAPRVVGGRSASEPARSDPPREAPAPAAPPAVELRPQPPARDATPPPAAVQPAPSPPTPAAAKPVAIEPEVPAAPAAPGPPVVERIAPAPTAGPPAEDDEAAIRRVIATYGRAIESKDLSLFRSIKPNLSSEEERRLRDGFRAVSSQQVNLTILTIDRRGQEATVVVRRRDTIQPGGRPQTAESQQTIRLARTTGAWVILEIR